MENLQINNLGNFKLQKEAVKHNVLKVYKYFQNKLPSIISPEYYLPFLVLFIIGNIFFPDNEQSVTRALCWIVIVLSILPINQSIEGSVLSITICHSLKKHSHSIFGVFQIGHTDCESLFGFSILQFARTGHALNYFGITLIQVAHKETTTKIGFTLLKFYINSNNKIYFKGFLFWERKILNLGTT